MFINQTESEFEKWVECGLSTFETRRLVAEIYFRLLSLKDATTDAANDYYYYYDEDVWQKLQKRTQPRDIYDLQATTGRHDGLVNHVASGAPPVSLLHKVIHSKYSKQWSYFMAYTMDCDCSEILIMV